MVVEQNLPSCVEMPVVRTFTLREILTFPKPKSLLPVLLSLPILSGQAAPIIPTDEGMTWSYHMLQEAGEGIRFSSQVQPESEAKIEAIVAYRLAGKETIDGKPLLKFEMHREGLVTNTDFVTVDERGINCRARLGVEGEMINLNPPQTIVAAPLEVGTAWDFEGKAGEAEVRQHYRVVGKEEVIVPAGKFNALHIYGEQTMPNRMTIDRWFVPGTGIVKDVTSTRSETGELLRRISLELKTRPVVAARPEVKPAKKLAVGLSTDAIGGFTRAFRTDTPKIFARWQGHGLRAGTKIRAVWIAANLGDVAPKDYTIDEATATATVPDARGLFTLGRPDGGWAPGDYRVDFYLDDALTETVTLKIAK